jgi:hypothetical protein
VIAGQVGKMRRQAQIDCGPVRNLMSTLLETAQTYRDTALFELNAYAEVRKSVASARARFATPPREAGPGIPQAAIDQLKSKTYFNNTMEQLRRDAVAAGLARTVDLPPGADPAILAFAKADAEGGRVDKGAIFFFAKDSADDAAKRKSGQELLFRFRLLQAEWKKNRTQYLKTFGSGEIDKLNARFANVGEDLSELRDGYAEAAAELRGLANSNKFEHCIGRIKVVTRNSVVAAAPFKPFFEPGPEDTPDALPGMGFKLAFEPNTPAVQFVPIPSELPYKFGVKSSFSGALDLAMIELIQALTDSSDLNIALERIWI